MSLRLKLKLKLNLYMNLSHKTEIETQTKPQHQTEPLRTTFNVLITLELMKKIKSPNEVSVQQDQPLSPIKKNLDSDLNDRQPAYDQTPLQTPTINPIIGQTTSHVATYTNNDNCASESKYISYCSDHSTDFNVIDSSYDFEIEDLPPEIYDDDIKVDVEPVCPATSKPF